MRIEDKYIIGSVRELSEYLSKKWRNLPEFDFCMLDCANENEIKNKTILEIYDDARGWYGLKHYRSQFDSDEARYVSDYYGGGSYYSFELEYYGMGENMEEKCKGSLERMFILAFDIDTTHPCEIPILIEFI